MPYVSLLQVQTHHTIGAAFKSSHGFVYNQLNSTRLICGTKYARFFLSISYHLLHTRLGSHPFHIAGRASIINLDTFLVFLCIFVCGVFLIQMDCEILANHFAGSLLLIRGTRSTQTRDREICTTVRLSDKICANCRKVARFLTNRGFWTEVTGFAKTATFEKSLRICKNRNFQTKIAEFACWHNFRTKVTECARRAIFF